MTIKRILICVLSLTIIAAMSISAMAENVAYSFNIRDTGRNMNLYDDMTNRKLFTNQSSTIYCANTTTDIADANGQYELSGTTYPLGVRLALCYYAHGAYMTATSQYWYKSGRGEHPTFVSGAAAVNRDYYIWGRVDDSYYDDTVFAINGWFNSDYTRLPNE